MAPIAEIKDMSFHYPGQSFDLFRKLDLCLHENEITVIAGPNGVGKSTMINLLSGRLRPITGTVRLFGKTPMENSRIPDLGLVVEPFHPELSPLPVRMSLKEIRVWLDVLDGISPELNRDWSRRLGLNEKLESYPIYRLSKGERQRALLTVVFSRNPKLILADEPLEGLDRKSKVWIGESLRAFAKETKGAVLWISHNLAESLPYADRFYELDDARLTEHRLDRYRIRFTDDSQETQAMAISSLYSLSAMLEKRMTGKRETRIEIEDTLFQTDEETVKS